MRSTKYMAPWNLKFAILGLALTASPLSIGTAIAGQAATPTAPSVTPPLPMGEPIDKVAAARIPEGRQTVTTIDATLESAYRNNTELKELQAQVRAKDESVPQALAGFRPTVAINASIRGEKNILSGDVKDDGDNGLTDSTSGRNISTASAGLRMNQNLFNGGKTVASTAQAESAVQAARQQLADKEREVLFNAVQAFFTVIERKSELEYNNANETALKKTLEATQDKFNVGEETRTSIAQAQANLAQATALREASEAEVLTAEATFEQVTGARPGNLKKPATPPTLPSALKDAMEVAKKNNPSILTAIYQEKADRTNIKVNDADLLPKLDLQADVQRQGVNTLQNVTRLGKTKTNDFTTGQSVLVNLSVPLYEAGATRAKTREFREIAEQRRINIETVRRRIIQELVRAWESHFAAKANVKSYETQVRSLEVSLEGTRQEMLVGSKILLDVLNEQQKLVQSQTNLVRAEQNYYQTAYTVIALMGRLNALDLKLKVKRYNPEVHYRDVRNSW
ncbi:MAG: TolC family outer membrane protein [Alphaproteobacteria bacterium]|nr:TolC family outer membrane protein [Alphaproteobacteria bacterium]